MTDSSSVSQSNSQRALEALRVLIFSGELAAGSDHLESELADRLGMSRTPVREAVLILESQGLLEVRPRKGVRITTVSPADMGEVYDVLMVLEGLAAERAAAADISAKDLYPLEAAIIDMNAAIQAEDRQAWAAADDRFHVELVRLGGNIRVVEIFERMRDQVRRARAVTLFVRPMPVKSNDDHRAVFEAIRDGKPEVAGSIHRAHREQARDELVGLLETLGLKQI